MAVAHLVWGALSITGGIAMGYLLGILPFFSWHFAIRFTDGFRNRRRIGLAVLLMLAKYGVIAGFFWWIFSSDAVNILAFGGGMFIIVAILLALGFGSLGGETKKSEH